MHGDHTRAPGPRVVLFGAHVAIVGAALWLLLGGGLETLDGVTPFRIGTGPWGRRALLAAMSFIYLLRFAVTGFVLLRRRVEWSEVAAVVPWLAFLHWGMALLGGSASGRLGVMGAVGAVLYVAGSYLNTASEWRRMRWKRAPGHAGKLYTEGLFALAMHVNYFGDIVLFTGFALATGRYVALTVPVLMAASFALVHVPVLDAYLLERYGAEFRAYAQRTRRLIPGVW